LSQGPRPGSGAEPGVPVEQCELCGETLDDRHGHLVDLEKRSLSCTCRACYLLFTREGAGRGRYRAVPDRVHTEPDALTEADWDELGIPVGTAFLFVNSALDRVVGCYPSPAGPTECELDLAAWQRLVTQQPLLAALVPDVEAIYVTHTDRGIEAYLVPIDECYALVGRVRLRWSGFDGGQEVRDTLAGFVADLRERARPLDATQPMGAPWPS
jgi:hypothetical protein